MGFKDHTKKLLGLSRMAGDQYVPSEEDPETIMTTLVPVAMNIVQNHLSGSTFCDRFSIPLISLARQVQFSMSSFKILNMLRFKENIRFNPAQLQHPTLAQNSNM